LPSLNDANTLRARRQRYGFVLIGLSAGRSSSTERQLAAQEHQARVDGSGIASPQIVIQTTKKALEQILGLGQANMISSSTFLGVGFPYQSEQRIRWSM